MILNTDQKQNGVLRLETGGVAEVAEDDVAGSAFHEHNYHRTKQYSRGVRLDEIFGIAFVLLIAPKDSSQKYLQM